MEITNKELAEILLKNPDNKLHIEMIDNWTIVGKISEVINREDTTILKIEKKFTQDDL